VRHVPDRILPPPGGQPGGGPDHGPPMPVRIVRDDSAVTGWCPHCGGPLELSTVGARWHVQHPTDVADRLLPQLGILDHEELHVLLLDVKCGVIAQQRLYVGNVSSSVVRVGELFSEAVRRHAGGVILVHNHPSGDITPSPDDVQLTVEAVAAGRLLDIPVLDHVVVGGSSYRSLRERGMAFDDPEGAAGRRRSSSEPGTRRSWGSPTDEAGGAQ
jgi:hypothetical protein